MQHDDKYCTSVKNTVGSECVLCDWRRADEGCRSGECVRRVGNFISDGRAYPNKYDLLHLLRVGSRITCRHGARHPASGRLVHRRPNHRTSTTPGIIDRKAPSCRPPVHVWRHPMVTNVEHCFFIRVAKSWVTRPAGTLPGLVITGNLEEALAKISCRGAPPNCGASVQDRRCRCAVSGDRNHRELTRMSP